MCKRIAVILAGILYGSPHLYPQQEGQLDLTFGVNGMDALEVDTLSMSISDMVVQADGRILTTGRVFTPEGWDVFVIRRLADGGPDATFGDMGFVRMDLGTYWDDGRSIVVQSDGRILVASESSQNGLESTVIVLRYLPDGSLDDTFGEDGIASAPPSALGHPYDMAVNADGTILVVGTSAHYENLAVYRFTASGEPDATFQQGGVLVDHVFGGTNQADRVCPQEDGKILLACLHGSAGAYDVSIVRLMADGTRDTDFGNNGVVYLNIGPGDALVGGIGLQSEGRIVVACYRNSHPHFGIHVARFRPDGTPDPEFGTNGTTIISTASVPERVRGLVVQPDDAILLGGSKNLIPTGRVVMVARLTTDGHLDGTFGTGGIVHTVLQDAPYAECLRVALQLDGRLIAAVFGGYTPILLRYLAGPFVGIAEEIAHEGDLVVVPNPAADAVVIQFDLDERATISMDVLDVTGKVVAIGAQQLTLPPGAHRIAMSMERLSRGLYTVRLSLIDRNRMVRIVKE